MPKIVVTYDISADGILNVSAEVENVPGGKKTLTINNTDRQLSTEDIERMVAEGEQFREADLVAKENQEARQSYEQVLLQTLQSMPKNDEDEEMRRRFHGELDWLTDSNVTKAEVEERQESFMRQFSQAQKEAPSSKVEETSTSPVIEEVD